MIEYILAAGIAGTGVAIGRYLDKREAKKFNERRATERAKERLAEYPECFPSRQTPLEQPQVIQEIHYHINVYQGGAERVEKYDEQPQTTNRLHQQLGEEFRLLLEGHQEIQGGHRDKATSTNHHRTEIPNAYSASSPRINRNGRNIRRESGRETRN